MGNLASITKQIYYDWFIKFFTFTSLILVSVFYFCCDYIVKAWQGIFVAVAINLLVLLYTFIFVQDAIDSIRDEEQKAVETKKVASLLRIIGISLYRYRLYFNTLVCRACNRNNGTVSNKELKSQFEFIDLIDLYEPSNYILDIYTYPVVEMFYQSEKNLRDLFIIILTSNSFKHYENFLLLLESFVQTSNALDMRNPIIGNYHLSGQNVLKFKNNIKNEFSKHGNDWLKLNESKSINGEVIVPYIKLYEMLLKERDDIIKLTEFKYKFEVKNGYRNNI